MDDGIIGPPSSPAQVPAPPGLLARKGAGSRSALGMDGTVTLTGIVEQGVEFNRFVLLDEAGSPLAQLGGQPTSGYPLGARVQVTGRFVTGLRTTAQQGRPFRVESLRVV